MPGTADAGVMLKQLASALTQEGVSNTPFGVEPEPVLDLSGSLSVWTFPGLAEVDVYALVHVDDVEPVRRVKVLDWSLQRAPW